MRKEDYTKRVLSCLRRLTAAEMEAVRAELDAHMEDRVCALLDLGYDEQLAEERAMAAMGDPEEVGRELNRAYPLRWLIVGRIAGALAVLLGCLLVFDLLGMYDVWDSVRARWDPQSCSPGWEERIDAELDIRMEVGSDVLRIYGTGIDEQGRLHILYCWYDKNPLGYIADYPVTFYDCRGKELYGGSGSSLTSRTAFHDWRAYLEHTGFPEEDHHGFLRSGDPGVTAVVERHGDRYEVEVPLDWEVEP